MSRTPKDPVFRAFVKYGGDTKYRPADEDDSGLWKQAMLEHRAADMSVAPVFVYMEGLAAAIFQRAIHTNKERRGIKPSIRRREYWDYINVVMAPTNAMFEWYSY